MNIGVIFAGGVGKRMNSRVKPKQFLNVYGKPIIIHTLEVFDSHPDIDAIVVACLEEWIPYLNELIDKYNLKKVKKVVPGGKSGQESIYHGLLAAEEVAGQERSIVLIHDGVRPMIYKKTIDAVGKRTWFCDYKCNSERDRTGCFRRQCDCGCTESKRYKIGQSTAEFLPG